MPSPASSTALFLSLLALSLAAREQPRPVLLGVDSRMAPPVLADTIANDVDPALWSERWVRLPHFAPDKREETATAFAQLRSAGVRTLVLLRRPGHAPGQSYLPVDLREAFERGRQLGTSFGNLVDAWEVDNEPDLGFVPESAERYAAYLKATSLGLRRGFAEAKVKPETRRSALRGDGEANLKPEGSETNSGLRSQVSGLFESPQVSGFRFQPSDFAQASLVLMGSLGLPPGPWLERFAANDGFAYTDGYNYHYYGYAEDFTGVYRQHENAVAELGAGSLEHGGQDSGPDTSHAGSLLHAPRSLQKNLPVFLSEVGYGMLGKSARDTKEGRLRQWRWFRSVGEQIVSLRIEASMAFSLLPFLEYDTLAFGLTMPATPGTEKPETGDRKPEGWVAGGIEYSASDFSETSNSQLSGLHPQSPAGHPLQSASGHGSAMPSSPLGSVRSQVSPSPWMHLIGRKIAGNEITPALAWWLAGTRQLSALSAPPQLSAFSASVSQGENRGQTPAGQQARTASSQLSGGSRSWSVTTVKPSPIVLDFFPDEGLQPLKRYNGIFVTGNVPPGVKPEVAKPVLPPVVRPPPPPKPVRSEEFMIHVRTQNGNLYEVYPTRLATPEWQQYLEWRDNFTMSFYGRAELPWRFKDNRPASLVVVMYPKQLPAVYEFRRVQLIELGARSEERGAKHQAAELKAQNSELETVTRYGSGRVILYNFSDKPIAGRLALPEYLTTDYTDGTDETKSVQYVPSAVKKDSGGLLMELAPGERREVSVNVQVAADGFIRKKAEILFIPESSSVPDQEPITTNSATAAARFVTEFFPALEGMKTAVIADLLQRLTTDYTDNTDLIRKRPRVAEEEPMVEQGAGSGEQGVPNPQACSAISAKPPSGLLASVSQGENRGQAPGGQQSTTARSQVSGFISFAQSGAQVSDPFTITVTAIPPGKPQRIEVEIPWPDGLDFPEDALLSLEYRLR